MISLIVDTNILIAELLRQRGRELIQNPDLAIYATERVMDETQYELRRRVAIIVNQGRYSEATGQNVLESARHLIETKIMLVSEDTYTHLEAEARDRIPRDPDDWPTVAAALALQAAIWTQDCDFIGCGCPTWTTETLLLHLRRQQL
jgi:predicted nucleic acid-binding protein